jgi:hypothetical protein
MTSNDGVVGRTSQQSGYTQIPNAFLDWTLPLCEGSEAKVALYIARRTLGMEKVRNGLAQIRLDQICHGWFLKNGSRADHGAGVEKATAVKALKGFRLLCQLPGPAEKPSGL